MNTVLITTKFELSLDFSPSLPSLPSPSVEEGRGYILGGFHICTNDALTLIFVRNLVICQIISINLNLMASFSFPCIINVYLLNSK